MRRMHGFGDRITRLFARQKVGSRTRIIRALSVVDYRPCERGGAPIEYMKRITHRRWPRGSHWRRGQYPAAYADWLAALPDSTWVRIDTGTIASPRG